jgi:PucR C-terminal helix-turn-helix domain/GGDEF-like domain
MAMLEQESLRARMESDLGELVACGATRGELVEALEAALACRLGVLGADEPGDDGAMSCPIVPGTEVLGLLQSDVPLALATAGLAECLEYGARIIGIELVRERAALETRWSLEADLLIELVEAGDGVSEGLVQRARHAGFDLARRWHVVLLEIAGGPAPSELVAAARRPASASERSMSCVLGARLAVAVCDEPDDAREAKLRHLHRVARGLGVVVHVGVSSPVGDFACGVRQAEAALRLATCGAETSTVYHKDLGSLRFLLNAPNQLELVSLVKTRIGPLAEHDHERQTELLQTLRVFLDEGGNRRRAAERCHVHQSTIKYRLRRIRELLDCDLADAHVRFDLMLALKVLELIGAVDAGPTTTRRVLQPALATR